MSYVISEISTAIAHNTDIAFNICNLPPPSSQLPLSLSIKSKVILIFKITSVWVI